jgi:hypothetical protein
LCQHKEELSPTDQPVLSGSRSCVFCHETKILPIVKAALDAAKLSIFPCQCAYLKGYTYGRFLYYVVFTL